MKPYHWHINNTKCITWFERDRAMIRLTDNRDQEIICLFDNDVSDFITDGFKSLRQSWHDALSEYASSHALTTKGK